jgi:hypothetical protein
VRRLTLVRYVIKTEYVREHEVQCDLAILCLRYLSLKCFREDISEDERSRYTLNGYYSFQDYAVSNWIKHIDTVIDSCGDVFTNPDYESKFGQALQEFIAAYPGITKVGTSSDDEQGEPSSQHQLSQQMSPEEQCRPFRQYAFYDDLVVLWTHIQQHQSSKFDMRNKISLKSLKEALENNRKSVESFPLSAVTVGEDTMRDYYGAKLFKCSRILCDFFYIGFETEKDRDHHHNRHERPFPCPVESCNQGPFGFASNKDRDRHVRQYHPEHSDRPPAFAQLSRRPVGDANFPCTVPGCGKRFTRNINLKGHIRSHFGERPYSCSTCGKAFTRINDCKRHERIHTRRGG